jgi:YD repeat-containing protein
MPVKTRQLISIILIAALWMPVVILPASVSADTTTQLSGTQSLPSSIFGLVWTKLALFIPGAAQQQGETAPPGMPALEDARRQPDVPVAPLSEEERKAKVASLKINPENEVTLEAGQQLVIAATPLDAEGDPVHGLGAEWSSDHPEVVSITADGLATAGETGEAQLTATAGNKQATLSVTVIPAQPHQTSSSQQSASINTARSQNRGIQSQMLNGEKGDHSMAASSAAPERSLSHAPRTVRLRAALAQVAPILDEDTRRYVSEVGAAPGQSEPGAATPAAATGGTEKPGTSNFNFAVPVVGLPGRGLDLSLALVYNSRLWNKKKNAATTTLNYDVDQSWPAPGFSLGFGKLLWSGSSLVLIDGGGTRHPTVPLNGTGNEDATQWQTTDGTFTRILLTEGNYKAIFANGTQILYGAGVSAAVYPIRITDRQGNFISISYYGSGPRISTITDTLNRVVTFKYEGNELVSITVPPYANGVDDRQVIRFYYSNITVNPTGSNSFSGVSVPATSQNKTVRVISRVYFPGTQTGYAYSYSIPYGMIYRVEQRRAMTVSTTEATQIGTVTGEGVTAASTEYNYPTTASALSEVPKYTRRTDDWAGRTTGTAAPYYTFNVTEGTTNLSMVTAPDGSVTETETYGSTSSGLSGLVKQVTIKSASGAVLSRTVYSWLPDGNDFNPRLTQVLSTNDQNQTKGVVYTYDTSLSYNNVTKVSERDFTGDGTLSAVELRRTETTYEKGTNYLLRGLVHLPTSVKVFEGGSNVPSSFVDYKYDEGGEAALTQRTSLSMYTSPQSAQRGNVTKVIAYSNAAAQDINTASINQTVYDVTGNPISQTLNCCQQKTITYSAAYMFAYPTSETKGSAPDQLTTSSTYDFNTGVALTSTDENNQVTALSYYPDSMRLDTIYRPDTSYTRYHYYDGLVSAPDTAHPHSYVAVATASGVGTVVWSYQFMDGRGAVARTFTNNTAANGWQTSDIEYDGMGRTKRSSSPYYSTGSDVPVPTIPGLWTSVEQYDEFGRATQVKLPDLTLVQTAYEGKVTTVTDQAGKKRRQVTDALGRVVRADEPDATGSLGTLTAPTQPTSYEYDALGNLTKITQAGPDGVTQERKFKYDSLGHLTHERQVEALASLDNAGARVSSGGLWTGVYKYNQHGLIKDAYDARGVHTTD